MHEKGLPSIRYRDVMETDAGLYEWVTALERFGVAVVRNTPTETSHVARLAERIGPVQRTIYGETWNVVVEENPINVAYTSVELPSHADLLYYEGPPGVQLLHFRETAASGGANMLVDGAAAYAKMLALYPQHVELLSRYNLAYQYRSNTHWMYRNRPPLEVDEQTGELIALNVSPPFEGPASCVPFDVMPAMIEAVDVLQRIVTSDPELLYKVRFNDGDVVTFNNRRVLHAREAIDEQSGRRHLEGTYVESDLFWSKVRIMRSQIEKEVEPVVTGAFGTAHI
jgi:gamma-butyrobetaine dioxygenase